MITNLTSLIKISNIKDVNLLQKAIIANALSIVDITASDKTTRKTFEDLLGPVLYNKWDLDRPFSVKKNSSGAYITTGVSTCGLVARGLWRRVGVDFPDLYINYKFGRAITDEIYFAENILPYGAWVSAPNTVCKKIIPAPGDYMIIGENLNTHALTVVEFGNDKIISVDGGQVDENTGLQCIKKIERKWYYKDNQPYVEYTNPKTKIKSIKKVLGWISFILLPFKDCAIVVPEGWNDE